MTRLFLHSTVLCLLVVWHSLPVAATSVSEAKALIEQARESEAITMLQKIASNKPDDYQVQFMLGVAETHQKNFPAAIRYFRRVIELRPALAEPHNNLAVIYNETGDIRAAVKELEASLELDPGYATAQENIGDMYVKLALQAYQKALIDDASPALKLRYERLLHLHDAVTLAKAPAVQKPEVSSQQPEVMPLLASDVRAEIATAVEQWRRAWSERNVEAYFSAYSDEFTPGPRFASRQAWASYKRRVIRKKSFIEVVLQNIQLSPVSDDSVQVDFIQHFKSDGYQSEDHKQLLLKKYTDGWKIVDEAIL